MKNTVMKPRIVHFEYLILAAKFDQPQIIELITRTKYIDYNLFDEEDDKYSSDHINENSLKLKLCTITQFC